MKYPVIYEKSADGWGAYIPDLPGCVALGFTFDETKRLIKESLEIHLRSMREDGDPIPEPSGLAAMAMTNRGRENSTGGSGCCTIKVQGIG